MAQAQSLKLNLQILSLITYKTLKMYFEWQPLNSEKSMLLTIKETGVTVLEILNFVAF